MKGRDAYSGTAPLIMTENQFELAQKADEAARAAGIQKAQLALAQQGTLDCIDCGMEIPEARRAAVPHTTRCTVCQNMQERTYRG